MAGPGVAVCWVRMCSPHTLDAQNPGQASPAGPGSVLKRRMDVPAFFPSLRPFRLDLFGGIP